MGTISKAIAAFLGSIAINFLMDQLGISIPEADRAKIVDVIGLIVGGILTAAVVYFAPKNKEQ